MSRRVKYPRLRDMPYYKTRVAVEDTRAAVSKLLAKYGIEDHRWTKLEGKETVEFIIDTVVQGPQGTQVRKAVQFDIPKLKALYGSQNKIIEVPESQTLRIFYHALKSVLESTKYGIMQLDHLLFSYTLTQLSTGETVQVKDLLDKHPLMLETGFTKDD